MRRFACIPDTVGRNLEDLFLDRPAYLDGKPEGDRSMPVKRRPSGGVHGGVPQDPRDMAKLRREALCRIPDTVGKDLEGRS